MKTTHFKILLLVGIFGVSCMSCKKEKQDQDKEISSGWTKTVWVASATSAGAGKSTFYYDIAVPEITQEVIDKGTILVYAKFVSDPDGQEQVKLLPSIYYNLGGAATQYRFQYSLSVHKIRVICDVLPAGSPSPDNQVRYVVIPNSN